MHITPYFARFRAVSLVCWSLATWFVLQGACVVRHPFGAPFAVSVMLLACLLAAVGVAFWPLGTDRRAGVVLDSKGVLLNLSHYAAFVAWDNVAQVGVCRQRRSLLALGSRRQLGIRLQVVEPYLQSYEERMPAARGVLAWSLRQLALLLRPLRRVGDAPIAARVAACRAATGYDLVVPEAFLGMDARAFAVLVEQHRPARR